MILLTGDSIIASKRIISASKTSLGQITVSSDIASHAIQQPERFFVFVENKAIPVRYLGLLNTSYSGDGPIGTLRNYFNAAPPDTNLFAWVDTLMEHCNNSYKNTFLYGATDEGTFCALMIKDDGRASWHFFSKGDRKIHHSYRFRKLSGDDKLIQMLNRKIDDVDGLLEKAWAYFAYQSISCSLNYDRYDVCSGLETRDVRPSDEEIEAGVKFISPLAWKGPKTRYYPQTQI